MLALALLASSASARGDEPRRLRLFASAEEAAADRDPDPPDRQWQPLPDPAEPRDGRGRALLRRRLGFGLTLVGILSAAIGVAMEIPILAGADVGFAGGIALNLGGFCLMGQAAVFAAVGVPIWAIGAHDARAGGEHAYLHIRARRNAGLWVLGSGFVLLAAGLAMIPGIQSARDVSATTGWEAAMGTLSLTGFLMVPVGATMIGIARHDQNYGRGLRVGVANLAYSW